MTGVFPTADIDMLEVVADEAKQQELTKNMREAKF